MISHDAFNSRPPILAASLTIGFATAVAMWLVGYATHLPAMQAPTVVVGALLIATQLAGGVATARLCRRSPLLIAGLAGLITSMVNLLVLGALLVEPEGTNSLKPGAVGATIGYAAFSIVAAITGAAIGRLTIARTHSPDLVAGTRTWFARFAIVTVAAALPVLLSGGFVTSTNAGLAVIDWPTSFGANMFLYPLSRMTGGVYYEHAHRLFGSLIGLTTLVLLIFSLRTDHRRWVKMAIIGAFVAICAQGAIGGFRVRLATLIDAVLVDNKGSVTLAMIHGITGQLVFAFLCVIAAFLTARWIALESAHEPPNPQRSDSTLRRTTLILLIVLVIQLTLGSVTRHFSHTHAALTHTAFALVVLTFAALAGFRASGRHKDEPILRVLGKMTAHTVGLQLALGAVTLFLVLPYKPDQIDPPVTVIFATAHQAVGALLLAFATLLFAWTRRLAPRAV